MSDSGFSSVGFIGLGVMGGPECANIARKSGLPVKIYDTDADKIAALERDGAVPATGIADVAETCEVIFLSLPGRPQVEAVVRGAGGLLEHLRPGQVLVDLSTSPVDLVQELGRELAGNGVLFIDAPVARTRQAAIDGTLSIMVGAPTPEDFHRIKPLLGCMATEVTHCGPTGAGAMVKVLNNMVVFETVVALSEAISVARRSGLVDPDTLFKTFAGGSADSFALRHHGMKAILPDEHGLGIFSSRYMHKDIAYAIEAATAAGLALPAATLASELLQSAIDLGYGDNYHTAVVRGIDRAEGEPS
ncbi:NAD(P)-dependent oxidoreductase [Saccharopolyspora sp. TS4A08]|uniref:NAD(P)-dependent oxidoreductase n=1 Tax=Saccharopolyspora ipomoeae TaxID=3042027 RepID=A0ABT6PRQ6_9PSEU|nr:NAD(P)-dependent oxidoreductase [Saccharopolyspora sp. TS4A08]MDI2030562.1 NAD(P)-dependent oxidoreductase [Saccharopolyspora sp. TS4A08]